MKALRIHTIRLFELRIPFCRAVSHNLQQRHQTESIIAVIKDSSGQAGFGEGTPRRYVTGEDLDGCRAASQSLAEGLLGSTFRSLDEMKAALRTRGASPVARRHPAAWCAVELACFDLWARCRERPLWRLFAERKVSRTARYSTVIPYVEDNDRLQELLQLAKGLQTPSLKLKVVDIDSAIVQLRLVRRVLGPHTDVRVDANAAFSVKQALAFIKAVAPLALSAIEQPVARDDLTGLQLVARRSPIPILADESMYTAKGIEYLIENKICQGLNIRLSSCGGLQNCLTIWPRARAQGMICQIGSHVGETAILALAGRHLAVISHDCTYLEGSFSKFVLAEDIVEEDITFGRLGHAPLPDGNGLGIRPRQALILKYGRLFGEYLPA